MLADLKGSDGAGADLLPDALRSTLPDRQATRYMTHAAKVTLRR